MEQEIHIILRFTLATGKVNLNGIVYRLKELRVPLLLKVWEQVLKGYLTIQIVSESSSKVFRIVPEGACNFLNRLSGVPK